MGGGEIASLLTGKAFNTNAYAQFVKGVLYYAGLYQPESEKEQLERIKLEKRKKITPEESKRIRQEKRNKIIRKAFCTAAHRNGRPYLRANLFIRDTVSNDIFKHNLKHTEHMICLLTEPENFIEDSFQSAVTLGGLTMQTVGDAYSILEYLPSLSFKPNQLAGIMYPDIYHRLRTGLEFALGRLQYRPWISCGLNFIGDKVLSLGGATAAALDIVFYQSRVPAIPDCFPIPSLAGINATIIDPHNSSLSITRACLDPSDGEWYRDALNIAQHKQTIHYVSPWYSLPVTVMSTVAGTAAKTLGSLIGMTCERRLSHAMFSDDYLLHPGVDVTSLAHTLALHCVFANKKALSEKLSKSYRKAFDKDTWSSTSLDVKPYVRKILTHVKDFLNDEEYPSRRAEPALAPLIPLPDYSDPIGSVE